MSAKRSPNKRHFRYAGRAYRPKWAYDRYWKAWRAVYRTWKVNGRVDSLHPYKCSYGGSWHWHIGHQRWWIFLPVRNNWLRKVVYPYRRVKSNIRLKIRTRDLRARHPPQRRRKHVRAVG